jgi:hypothetical protein
LFCMQSISLKLVNSSVKICGMEFRASWEATDQACVCSKNNTYFCQSHFLYGMSYLLS